MALKRGLRGGFLLLAATAATPVALSLDAQEQQRQSFLESYKAGVEAVEAEDWPRAEQAMRDAGAGRSEEADRLIRFLHLRPYLPHFYLGLALAEQGKCAEALEAFAESERQGVIAGLADELAVLRSRETVCRERLDAEAAARQRRQAVADLVAEAGHSAEAVAALADDLKLADGWERGDPSLAARLAEALSALDAARERLDHLDRTAGSGGPSDDGEDEEALLAEATDLARGTLRQLGAIRREAELRKAAIVEDREAAVRRTATLVRSGRELLEATRELAAAAPAVARRRATLEEAVTRAADAGDDEPLDSLQGLAGRVERAAAELRSAAEPPPPELLEAARAWLRGEPESVLASLPEPEPPFPEARARAHAFLLRAAAAFALHEAGGGTDPELLEAARRDAAACRREAPDLQPPDGAYSPRFRAFFAETEAAATPNGATD